MRMYQGRTLRMGIGAALIAGAIGAAGSARAQEMKPGDEGKGGAPIVRNAPVGTAFTYQGRLDNAGVQADGLYDFRFSLYDDPIGGNQIDETHEFLSVFVADGIFTIELDFGSSAFAGGARWLGIAVRQVPSVGPFITLSPRQRISPAPTALSLPNVYSDEASNFVGVGRDFRLSGNEVFGVRYTGSPMQYGGMYVETSDAMGWPFYGYGTNGSFRAWTYYQGDTGDWKLYAGGVKLTVPSGGGLRIESTTNADGLRVEDTGDDGIQIGDSSESAYPNYGTYIPSPGVTTYGLWPNTANASGDYGLYTADNIQAGNVAGRAFSVVGKFEGEGELAPGDLAAIAGVAPPLEGSPTRTPMVRLGDDGEATGLVGVVESRMVFEPAPGKEEKAMQSRPGAAKAGEYVKIVVLGIADVKVEAGAEIAAGQRLTAAATAGRARAMKMQTINGMKIAEGAQSIGVALAAPAPGAETIPVMVQLR